MIKTYLIKSLLMFLLFLTFEVHAKVSYFHDANHELNSETIVQAEFIPYTNPINQGLTKGTYWFKVDASYKTIIQILNVNIQKVSAFKDKKQLNSLFSQNYQTFELEKGITYLKVYVDNSAYIPIKTYPYQSFLLDSQKNNMVIGLFYGFGLMVLILNLMFYINFKDKAFIYYMLFLTSILLTFAHRDGFINVLGVSKEAQRYSEMLFHFTSALSSVLFASEYLHMKKHFSKSLNWLKIGVVIALLLDVVYLFTNNYLYNALSDTAIISLFIGIWLISLISARSHRHAQLFALAYSFIILFGIDFYLAKTFGWFDLGVDQSIIKLGSYFEMLIITLAVVLRMKSIKIENDEMRFEIENKIQEINNLVENQNNQHEPTKPFASYNLSKKELTIVQLIEQGKTNKNIALELNISINTVKYHVKNIYQKLDINSRKEIHTFIQ